MDVTQAILSDLVVFNKYAKFIPEIERRETWEEICYRNMAMHIRKFPTLKDTIQKVYKEYVMTKKVLPSMRSMQFAGAPIDISNSRIFNCAYMPIDHPFAFAELMFLLLGGTGVGYSVQKHHIDKLPAIQGPGEKTRRFLVGDSIEGWADAIKVLIKAYTKGKSDPSFDYRDIRPKGARLVTSGGKAPGPDPLRICLEQLRAIMNGAKGRKLTSLEIHDMCCHIADAVLAGGIRRAAMICGFDKDDMDMLYCKSGAWWELNPQRGRANNSVILKRGEVTEEEFKNLWELVRQSNAGEPGFFWTNDVNVFTNPCAEISLNPNQFCVAGDTKLITKEGIDEISNLVGKEVEIWNGEKWSKVSPYLTGTNDRLHRVYFSDGSYLDATDNHKFLVKNRFQKEYREVETLQLKELLKTEKYNLQIPRSNVVYEDGESVSYAYDLGFVLGDGFVYKNKKRVEANLYSNDKLLEFVTSTFVGEYFNYNGKKYTTVKFDLDPNFCFDMKYNDGLPKEIFSWDKSSILNFIAGWADADGSQASNGIRIWGREDKLRDAQLLLTKIGINASLNLCELAGAETNLGIRKNDLWYLQITRTSEIPCQRLICENEVDAPFKGKFQLVKCIETLEGTHRSFCLTEPELNQCVFNNVLTKQCNLSEVNVSDVSSQEEFNARVRAASIIGTIQAAYTDFHYLRNVWKETTEKEALIGVGLTGIASGAVLKLDLEEAAKVVKDTNEEFAKILGVNPAARTTTVKPSGTASLVVGSSSGIHAWHAKYYIRRMRVGKNEALYRYIKDNFPDLIEDCKFKPHLESVLSIPQKAPEGAIMRTESAMHLLERVKKFNVEWVRPGYRSGSNHHNVSCTISLRDEEWTPVGQWMWDNRETYNGISVLPYDGGSYIQAPFQDCDQETYESMLPYLHAIDLKQVIEHEDSTKLTDQAACAGNVCEVLI